MIQDLPNSLASLDPKFIDALSNLQGELRVDDLYRRLYAQDASIYYELPLGVLFPRSREDVRDAVQLASMFSVPLIPRAAGTSLAGQCVGDGLVLDTGRHMNQILEINADERWVRVQPGVILDDLNRALKPYGLFFAPDTSTSNRCMIGGMIGNNSCGTHSILYGTTRDHVLELEVVLSDGSFATLGAWDAATYAEQLARRDRLGEGLRALDKILRGNADKIRAAYPRADVLRRNNGYALDLLLDRAPYKADGQPFMLPMLIGGSEGTLAMITEAKLNLVPLPKARGMVVAHFHTLRESLASTVHAVRHNPAAVELIDRRILEQTRHNLEQERNRFFLEGDPEAILVIEFFRDSQQEIDDAIAALVEDLKSHQCGYAYPTIKPPQDKAVWELRKAGLGILMGIPGDVKAVTLVEDTAVAVDVLPDYIEEFAGVMARYGVECVYYAHASVGELHLRPEIDIKQVEGWKKCEGIARDVTELVKRYGGSISGEHGDGRLRGALLEQFYGPEIMALHRELKRAFDPQGIFNPGKIVDAEPIGQDLRFEPGRATPEPLTFFDWSADGGLVRAAEKCNGAGACRKRAEAGGTMCPSYMVTLDEKDSTRGRANVLRSLLLEDDSGRAALTSAEVHEAMDLCLSCKGCKSECPANVDMARIKAEFLQHYHDAHGTPLAARAFGHYGALARLGALLPALANFMFTFALTRWIIKSLLGVADKRELPPFAPAPFAVLWRRRASRAPEGAKPIWLYVDPFTAYTEPDIAIAAADVLEAAGFVVKILPVKDDGRTQLSKGLVRAASKLATRNVKAIAPLLRADDAMIVGLEPSALLTFRDEQPDLVEPSLQADARLIAARSVLLEEFIVAHKPAFEAALVREERGEVLLHGHCHQKALVGMGPTVEALGLAGYKARVLATGCCGMAGSFGYEAKHYELSMKVGELVLFPALRAAAPDALIAAPGTSCRHQIHHGAQRTAQHPAILLARALR
jgi:FAD/FMN-containing dehydrogenase/Fe-S oxidoreductase